MDAYHLVDAVSASWCRRLRRFAVVTSRFFCCFGYYDARTRHTDFYCVIYWIHMYIFSSVGGCIRTCCDKFGTEVLRQLAEEFKAALLCYFMHIVCLVCF